MGSSNDIEHSRVRNNQVVETPNNIMTTECVIIGNSIKVSNCQRNDHEYDGVHVPKKRNHNGNQFNRTPEI